jgi:methionine synthase I (cobalamin-dependent)
VAVLAGLHVPGSDPPYPGAPTLEPAAFADWLAPLGAQGVAILGGCCGVTPAHIAALAGTTARNRR